MAGNGARTAKRPTGRRGKQPNGLTGEGVKKPEFAEIVRSILKAENNKLSDEKVVANNPVLKSAVRSNRQRTKEKPHGNKLMRMDPLLGQAAEKLKQLDVLDKRFAEVETKLDENIKELNEQTQAYEELTRVMLNLNFLVRQREVDEAGAFEKTRKD